MTTSEFIALLYITDTKKTTFRWLPCAKKLAFRLAIQLCEAYRNSSCFCVKKQAFFIEMNRA
ncbi:hypothetical protein AMK80_03550 [Escherichia coli]|nr:hypothetical protein AML41_07380 [Escherichia coli]KYT57637.1 hypothetical protein AML49_08820 [Escherichia coli]KYV48307.1 hypothetical protein AMK80_03550 [Escherichia coli]KYV77071.1 hypothetical protein AMK84_27260 [Escherichia coli]KYW62131.1 hypothetical protein AML84_07480 [Escherichia coli]